MQNDIVNVLFVECHPFASKKMEAALAQLHQDLSGGSALGHTRWAPDSEHTLRFVSAGEPDVDLHDRLTSRLAQVDTSVVLTNHFIEERLRFVGVRIAGMRNGQVDALVVDDEPRYAAGLGDEALKYEARRFLARCAERAEVLWAERPPSEVELVDLHERHNRPRRTMIRTSTSGP